LTIPPDRDYRSGAGHRPGRAWGSVEVKGAVNDPDKRGGTTLTYSLNELPYRNATARLRPRAPRPEVVGRREAKKSRADEERSCLVHDGLRQRYSALMRPQLAGCVGVTP